MPLDEAEGGELCRNQSTSADAWRQLLSGLPVAVEHLSFWLRSLDDEKAEALAPKLSHFMKLKELNFAWNQSISADGWRQLLSGLPIAVEDLSCEACSLHDEKAVALVDLSRLTKLRKVNFAGNSCTSADAWRKLLSGLPVAVEDLGFRDCKLDDETVTALTPKLSRFMKLKEVAFDMNQSISADGWRQLLSGLPVAVEHLSFRDCSLDDEKATALALELVRFARLKTASFGFNRLISMEGSARLLAAMLRAPSFISTAMPLTSDSIGKLGAPAALEFAMAQAIRIDLGEFDDSSHSEFVKALIVVSLCRINFDGSKSESEDRWQEVIQGLPVSAEELSFRHSICMARS